MAKNTCLRLSLRSCELLDISWLKMGIKSIKREGLLFSVDFERVKSFVRMKEAS